VIKAKWRSGFTVFSPKNGQNLRKNVGIFPKNRCFSKKKCLHFFAKLLMQRFLEVGPRCMTSALPNPPTIKRREAYWCYFSVFVFLLSIPFLENFLPTPFEADG